MSEELLKLSVSKTKSFEMCRRQYQFNYILKMPQPDRDYFVLGSFCHLVLENFHQQFIDGCLLPFHIAIKDSWNVAWQKYKSKMTPEMKQECWKIIDGYLRKITKDKNNGESFNILAVEHPFDFHLSEKVIIRGSIDIVQKDADNTWHVADWKSTKNPKHLENDNFFQIKTYCFVLLQEHPEIAKFKGSYVLLRHDFRKITKEFSLDEILAVRQKYLDYANQIESEKDFKATPNQLCGWCAYLEHCDEGRTQVANSCFNQQQKVFGAINW